MRTPRATFLQATFAMASALCISGVSPAAGYTCFEAALDARPEADGVHLGISLTSGGWEPLCWNSTPVAVDIYRHKLGGDCGTAVRITAEPIPWVELSEGFANLHAQIVDSGTTPGNAYRYTAQAVDAERNPIAGNAEVQVGEITRGVSLLGHGTLVGGPDGGYSFLLSVSTCPEECSASGYVAQWTAGAQAYINTNTPLAIYGEVLGQDRIYNLLNSMLRIDAVSESQCLVAVQPTTWGDAKRLYR